MAEVDSCTRCESVEVTNNAEALQCDLCSGWEHRICIRECDRPSVELYAALTTAPSKAILFVCSKCRRKGDVARRLFQLENASERANERSQAAERLLLERQALVETLQSDKGALQKEISRLLIFFLFYFFLYFSRRVASKSRSKAVHGGICKSTRAIRHGR